MNQAEVTYRWQPWRSVESIEFCMLDELRGPVIDYYRHRWATSPSRERYKPSTPRWIVRRWWRNLDEVAFSNLGAVLLYA